MGAKNIALTGGIGSGKTFVASIFRLMGIPVYDSDENAKRLMIQNKKVVKSIKKEFGEKAYLSEGMLNKSFIAENIFNHKDKLQAMNSIVHPAVRNDYERWASEQKGSPYLINEAALFIENGTYKNFDALIGVLAPMPLRIKRIVERDHLSSIEIIARINNQSTDQAKLEVSDFIIYNDKIESLFQQCSKIHQRLINNKY